MIKSLAIKSLATSAFQLTNFIPLLGIRFKHTNPFRQPSVCEACLYPPDKKPCFDIRDITIQRGNFNHGKMIRSFLYTNYWPREPSIVGLWMSLQCPYLEVLTEKYSYSGDRFIAYESIPRTGEQKMVGVCVAHKIFPWAADELEEWAHYEGSKPERTHMYFTAHCYKSPNLFDKYHVSFLYDIEVLTTSAEVTGQGVATLLMKTVIDHANDLRYPLVTCNAVSHYGSKICERVGMKPEWSMNYTDYVDTSGRRVFFPRRPHHTVTVYSKFFDPKIGGVLPCEPDYMKS